MFHLQIVQIAWKRKSTVANAFVLAHPQNQSFQKRSLRFNHLKWCEQSQRGSIYKVQLDVYLFAFWVAKWQ